MATKKRAVFRIQLTHDAKRRLLDISDRLGVTQIALTSRLTEWFAGQPELIQAAVLGLYPDVIKEDVATLILKRMAGAKAAKADGKLDGKFDGKADAKADGRPAKPAKRGR